jgi:hypothetical protein
MTGCCAKHCHGGHSDDDYSNGSHHRHMRKSGSRIPGAFIFGIIVATIEMALLLWLIYG